MRQDEKDKYLHKYQWTMEITNEENRNELEMNIRD